MRKSTLAILGIVLFSFIISAYFYPKMPARMVTHWNSRGEPNGYMQRFWGMLTMPLVLAGLALLFLIIPIIDPLRANIEGFRGYYDGFILLFFIFMLSVQSQLILWNSGRRISPNVIAPIGSGILFFYVGILCENAKRNWFIGIRTPWTLSSKRVWKKTHRIGGRLFKIAGIITIAGVFFQRYALLFILVPVLSVAAYTTVYSYIEYRRESG